MNHYSVWKEILVFCLLSLHAIQDHRSRTVNLYSILPFAAAGILLTLLENGFHPELLAGFGPGLVLLGVSILTHGAVGMGDSLILLAMAPLLSWERILGDLLTGLLLSSLAALYLLVIRRKKRSDTLPFLPFLLAGHTLLLLLSLDSL